jgi:KUP system potassium uptake protein
MGEALGRGINLHEKGDGSSIRADLGRCAIGISARSSMPFWQQRLFIMLANQSARAIEYFGIPPDRVVELGMQMSL